MDAQARRQMTPSCVPTRAVPTQTHANSLSNPGHHERKPSTAPKPGASVQLILAKSGSAGGVIWPSSAPSVEGDGAIPQWTSQYGQPRRMTHTAVTVAAVALAATTGHRRHRLIGRPTYPHRRGRLLLLASTQHETATWRRAALTVRRCSPWGRRLTRTAATAPPRA